MGKRRLPVNAPFAPDFLEEGKDIALNVTWISGRPIFRRVVDVSSQPATTALEVLNDNDRVEQIISLSGWILGNATELLGFPYGIKQGGGGDYAVLFSTDSKTFSFESSRAQPASGVYIVIDYSKRAA